MAVRITIETASRAEAELIAQKLPIKASARSWRGLGVIRLAVKSKDEKDDLLEAVSRGFAEHKLGWTRVRYDDEERVFRANGNRRNDPSQG
jgi:hypothetical protein